MLIRFHVSNFLSFDEEVELSMIPGKTRKHPGHVTKSEGRHDIDILRSAIIYGANASGKSNIVKAMAFAQELIVEGTHVKESIPRTRFKLKEETVNTPSKFEFEFKAGERCYIYGFELNRQRIYEEWLYEIRKTTETMLFERATGSSGETSIEFGKIDFKNEKEKDLFDLVAMGTRPNQLFLTESLERNIMHFDDVYKWFREKLIIIFPASKFIPLATIGTDQDLANMLINYLEQLGTGICGFELSEVDPEKEFPEDVINILLKSLQERDKNDDDSKMVFFGDPQDERYLAEIVDEELKAKKLTLRHQMSDSEQEILLGMAEESDGTRRLLDLLPGLANPNNEDKVYVVDELDRSLHPVLSHRLVKLFLENEVPESQLIATTHASHLLDQDLLRRDEVWFVEKDKKGASHVYSLEEYAPRNDKDIEKGYMAGRYGAIPILGNMSFATQEEE
ncbi:MAG: ATP-binding protein [Chloroflexota bacterium]|nr:MAG: ATP-binding protein [Chloroflexota bacterium]